MKPTLSRRNVVGLALAVPALVSRALAQSAWPTRAVKLVVPAPPGGAVDSLARVVADRLGPALGQNVIVENRAGAAGLIGTKAVAQSTPDGYTLGYVHAGLVTLQAMNARLDLLKELRPVARMSVSPFLAVVNPRSPYKTLQDLVAAVQASPGKITYGSGGVGSPAHLVVESMREKLGNFDAVHVPFKGAAEVANAIVAGDIDFQVGVIGSNTPLVVAGKLRALAVTSRARLAQLPDVPTMMEAGIADFSYESWGGLAAAAGTPDAVIARLNAVLPGILASAAVQDLTQKHGSHTSYAGAQAFTAEIAQRLESERVLVRRLGMTLQQ